MYNPKDNSYTVRKTFVVGIPANAETTKNDVIKVDVKTPDLYAGGEHVIDATINGFDFNDSQFTPSVKDLTLRDMAMTAAGDDSFEIRIFPAFTSQATANTKIEVGVTLTVAVE